MVTKTKKLTKIKSKSKSTKLPKSTKLIELTQKQNGLSKLSLIGLSSIAGAGLLGLGTLGALAKSELLPYIKENYGEYAFGYKKEKQQFDIDFEHLINKYPSLTFKFYMKNNLIRLRHNYIEDKEKIREYNKHEEIQILTLQDYIEQPSFKPFRSRPRFYSLDNLNKK